VQLAVGVLTCVLVYRLGTRICDRRVGFVAGLITPLFGSLMFLDAELGGAGRAA
jgi:4-amino-4-deoxy-L-arabinose transferase-like glycosyltransferase